MDAHLEWLAEDRAKCSCGFPLDETTKPGRDDDFDAEPVVCHACAARDRAQRAWRDKQGDENGLRWRVFES
jgi:hypothetical protein